MRRSSRRGIVREGEAALKSNVVLDGRQKQEVNRVHQCSMMDKVRMVEFEGVRAVAWNEEWLKPVG